MTRSEKHPSNLQNREKFNNHRVESYDLLALRAAMISSDAGNIYEISRMCVKRIIIILSSIEFLHSYKITHKKSARINFERDDVYFDFCSLRAGRPVRLLVDT